MREREKRQNTVAIWHNTKSNNQTTISICIDVWSICFFLCVSFTLAPYAPWYAIPCDEFYSFFLLLSLFFLFISLTLHFPIQFILSFVRSHWNKSVFRFTYLHTKYFMYYHIMFRPCVAINYFSCYYCCNAAFERRKKQQHNQAQIKWEMPIDFSK